MDTVAEQQIARPVRGAEIGSVIGGSFGLVFVLVNSADMSPVVRLPVVAVAVAAFITVLVLGWQRHRLQRASIGGARRDATSPFGWQYWTIVAVEAIALFGGGRVLAVLGLPQLGVAWVCCVVGTHFFALARVFRLARFHVLAGAVTVCGAAGFGLAALGLFPAIALISGVLPGLILLGFALSALIPQRRVES